ncbi:MAG: histidine--tRNA ligase [Candidatus Paceibacterota bacterium]|jgi:histidyl-tRNA synthetase
MKENSESEKKEKKIEPAVLQGFMELLPAEQILFDKMLNAIRRTYELFGFIPLDTALIEKVEVLLAKSGGETAKQVYYLQKEGQALRVDLTISLARYVASHYAELAFPFRRYQIGKVYRGERPQKGRYREFYQCDIDIIGDGQLSLMNDAEIPSVICAVFNNLGFGPFTIRINNRKILKGFFNSLGIAGARQAEVLRIVDKLEKIGQDAARDELAEFGIPAEDISKIFAFIGISGKNQEIIDQLRKTGIENDDFTEGVRELEEVSAAVLRFGVPQENLAIDLKIARGLDYYTGTVYETFLNDHPDLGSICSGGRYDNLADSYTSRSLPGVGISIGFTRLFSKLLEKGIIKPEGSTLAQALIIPMDGQMDKAIEASAALRKKGISSAVYFEQAKTAKAFKYANRLGVPFAMIIGENEAKEGKVSLKDMASGEQELVSLEEAAEKIEEKSNNKK